MSETKPDNPFKADNIITNAAVIKAMEISAIQLIKFMAWVCFFEIR
jgi:hypothetical protein